MATGDPTGPLRPPFKYYGSKVRVAPLIVAMFPEHNYYVEPFAGSLAVLLAKRRSPSETVNDIDGDLMTFWRVLRDRPDELIRVCALTPHSRAEFEACYDLSVADDVERARRVWVRLTQGRSPAVGRATGWSYNVLNDARPKRLLSTVGRMPAVAERLMGVSLECRPALDVISRYGQSRDVLVYVDPPYMGSTRKSRGYGHEMADEAAHRELAEVLRGCSATVVLSGYHDPLYDALYGDWHRVDLHTGTSQGGQWSPRVEILWSNRPLRCDGQIPFPEDGLPPTLARSGVR